MESQRICTWLALHPVTMQDDASASSSLYDACPEYASTRWFILTQQERFVSLLRQWDVDGDGCINPKEFRDACRVMLLDDAPNVPRAVLEELYEEIDVDGTSNIPFEDLETALRVMPCPDPPRGLETVDEDTVDAGAASPTTVAARRDRRRSKSEPSSPQTSARGHASPTPRRLLFDTSAQSPGSPTTRRPTTLPSVAKPLTMHASGAQSLHTSPVCRPPNIQPPRRTNLPALSPRSVGGDSPRSHRSLGRASHHSYSYSSSSTTTTRTRSISPKLRAQREKELTAQLERRRLPGFQTPGASGV